MNSILRKLNKELSNNSQLFFETMGGLHDCKCNKLYVDLNKNILAIEIDDLYSNFLGLEGYIECKNIKLIIKNSKLIEMNLSTFEDLTIDEINIYYNNLKIMFTNGDIINLDLNDQYSIQLEF
jgi:hypothetical protein